MLKHKSKTNKKNFLKPPPNLLRKLSCRGWSASSSRTSSSGGGSSHGSYTLKEGAKSGKVCQGATGGVSVKNNGSKVVGKRGNFNIKKKGSGKNVTSKSNSGETTREVHFEEREVIVEDNFNTSSTSTSCENNVNKKMVSTKEKKLVEKLQSNVDDDGNEAEDKTKFR